LANINKKIKIRFNDMEIKLIEMVLGDNLDFGISAISLVDRPAIESDFIALSAVPIKLAKVDEEKRILMGAVLIPDRPILRLDEKTGEEYNIFFSKETVRKASERFLTLGNQNNTTLQHKKPLENLSVVELWLVEDVEKDKSAIYGLDAPVGSCVVSIKVNNDEIWEEYIKTGFVKGVSIKGMFSKHTELSIYTSLLKEIEMILCQ